MAQKKHASSLWLRLSRHLLARKTLVLVAVTLTTLFCLALIPVLPFSADPSEFLPVNNPDVKYWLDMSKRFGALDMLMIGLEEPHEALSPDGLARVARITDRLAEEKAQGILSASSLTNVSTLRESGGTVNAELLVNAIPRVPEERQKLITRILGDVQVPGAYVSHDLMGYLMFVRADDRKDAREVAQRTMDIVEQERGDLKAVYYGAPFIAVQLTKHIYAQLDWLVPLLAFIIIGVLAVSVRRVSSILVILVSSCVPILWWFGLCSLLRIPLTASAMIVALFIPVLASLVYARGLSRWRRLPPGHDAVPFGGQEAAILLAIGLSCLPAFYVQAPFLRSFALAGAAGCLAILLFGLFGFNAIAGLFATRGTSFEPAAVPCPYAAKTRALVFVLALLVLAGGIFGARQQRFMMTPKDIFSERDQTGQAIGFFDRRFGGSDFLQIGIKGDMRDPGVAARVARLTDLLEGSGRFADLRSITQVLSFLGQQFGGVYRVPADRESLNNLWFFLEGQTDVKAMVSDARDEGMLAARLPGLSPLTPAEWIALGEQAVRDSQETGDAALALRLTALARRYGLDIPEARLKDLGRLRVQLDAPETKEALAATLKPRLAELLMGPESPYNPKPEEWEAIWQGMQGASSQELALLIAAQPSYVAAQNPPALAADVATMLTTRREALIGEANTEKLLAHLIEGQGSARIPSVFSMRAKGALAEWLMPAPKPEKEPVFTVSGYPAMEAKMGGELKRDILLCAAGMPLVIFLIALAFTRRLRPLAWAFGEALLVASLTLAVGRFAGLYMDVASATVYLLPIGVTFLISPRLWRENDTGFLSAHPRSFVFAFGLMGVPFLFTGIMPLVRLGGVLAAGLLLAWLVSRISARLGSLD